MPRKPISATTAGVVGKKKNTAKFISAFHKNPTDKSAEEVQEYQRASLKYGARFDTSKWLVAQLPATKSNCPYSLLDVGALVLGYEKYCPPLNKAKERATSSRWIEAEYINLQAPPGHLAMAIQQKDLFDVQKCYDIVCLSLVLNFVPQATDRGRMLLKASQITNLGGFLYIVLPKACMENSRYLDLPEFNVLLSLLGFVCIKHHYSDKLYYGIFQKQQNIKEKASLVPKEKYPKGKRNNFKIAL